MIALGLDIGTSVLRAAVFRGETPELLQFPDGSYNSPAVASVQKGGFRVGRSALTRAATHPRQTVRAVKRLLGRTVDDPVVAQLVARAALDVETRPDGGIALNLVEAWADAEDIVAAFIKNVLDVAEQTHGERPSSAVLTAPYWYGPRQRASLSEAAKRAGIASLQVLSEATCTALSLIEGDASTRLAAIVDVGAGGCTASVLELGPSRVRLLSSVGDPFGGGEDIDWALLRAVRKGLAAQIGEFPGDPGVLELLRQTCESAKQALSQASSVTSVIPFLPIGEGVYNHQVRILSEHLDRSMRDTVARVAAACGSALAAAGLERGQLDVVIAAGGTARLAAVRSTIEAVFGPLSSRKLDPDGSVALGAACQAAMIDGLMDGVAVIDVLAATTNRPPPAQAAGQSLPPASVRPASTSQRPASPSVRVAPPGQSMPPAPRPAGQSVSPPRARSVPAGPQAPERVRVSEGAFQVEMATLLASLRAGAVSDGGRAASASGAVSGRASDLLEEESTPSDEEIARLAAASQELWGLLVAAMQAARQYRWDHPQTSRQLQRALEAIGSFHASAPRSLLWDVGALHLSYRGQIVWRPDRPPYDRMPYELFSDGLRKVQLKPGLTAAELQDFLGVLMRDATSGFGAEDDAATALWDRRLSHVGWLAVDAFSDADDPMFQAARDEIAQQLALTGEGASLLGAYVAARRSSGDLANLLVIDPAARQSLISRLEPAPEEWLARYASGVVASWSAAPSGAEQKLLESLAGWSGDQLQARALVPLLGVHSALTGATGRCASQVARQRMRAALQQAMLPPERFHDVLSSLSSGTDVPEAVVTGLQRALEPLEPSAALVDAMLPLYESLPREVQKVCVAYLAQHLVGFEERIARELASFSPEDACLLLGAMRDHGSPQAMGAIIAALRSPHLEVRLSALEALPEVPTERIKDDIRNLIEDPAPEIRAQVLETVASRRILAAGPALTRRIQDDGFHDLAPQERRLLFKALGALSRSRAEPIAIEVLGRQTMFNADKFDVSRVIVAEFLAESDTEQALQALERAAKKKWFTSPSVRETALRGFERVSQRRSSLPPRNQGGA